MNELKPCPFCGGKAEIIRKQIGINTDEIVWVECKNCEAKSRCFSFMINSISPRAKASDAWFRDIRNAWNRRMEE